MNAFSSSAEAARLLERLGVAAVDGDLESRSPIDGVVIGRVASDDAVAVAAAVGRARQAFLAWRIIPPPHRGELVRLFGEEGSERRAGREVCKRGGGLRHGGVFRWICGPKACLAC